MIERDIKIKSIGGYYELEITKFRSISITDNCLWLKCGRNSLELIIKETSANHIFIPAFCCQVIPSTIIKSNIKFTYFAIDENFEISDPPKLDKGDYILYIDYFGLKEDYVQQLASIYGTQFILDNTMSLKMQNQYLGYWQFNSLRKYFGVPDGSSLISPDDKFIFNHKPELSNAEVYVDHLIKRFEYDAESGYNDFRLNEKQLGDRLELGSNLSISILGSVDLISVKNRRISNYNYVHEMLGHKNVLSLKKWNSECANIPFTYPYLPEIELRIESFWDKGIYFQRYWPECLEMSDFKMSQYFSKRIIHIPIDQRYGESEMKYIIAMLNAYG